MIKRTQKTKLTINIDGPEGNAFCLMGYARSLSKKLRLNTKEILAEMMSGDYLDLLKTFERHFGEYVTLETSNEQYLNL